MTCPDTILRRLQESGIAVVAGPDVVLDSRGRWVAQAHTADASLAVKAVDGSGSLDREVAAARTLTELGVPVAEVVADLGGDPHVIVSTWAPGVPLTSAMPHGAHVAAGAVLACLHDAPCPDRRASWFLERAPELLDWWAPHAPGPHSPDAVRAKLAELFAATAEAGTWGLFDARPDHMLVAGDGVRLIDVENLASFDPAMDVATCATFDPDLLPGLLTGYRSPCPSSIGARIPAYVVLRALAAARWRIGTGFDTASVPALLRLAASVDPSRPVEADGQLPRRR